MSDLPPELLRLILEQLEPGVEESIRTLTSFELSCRLFSQVCFDQDLWIRHHGARYKRGPAASQDPKKALLRRLRLDRDAAEAIRILTDSTRVRDAVFHDRRLDGMAIYEQVHYQAEQAQKIAPMYWLTHRHWARKLEKAILRDWAIETWQNLERHDYEQAAAAFCAFRNDDPISVFEEYDRLAELLEPRLRALMEKDPADQDIIAAVVQFMTDHHFVAASFDHFHHIDNHFLTIVQRKAADAYQNQSTGRQHATLPMSLVITFCALINRQPSEWGLEARASSFPGVMLATFKRGQEGDIHYVNVYENGSIKNADALHRLAATMGVEWSDDFVAIASARSLAFRIAQNILTSIRSQDVESSVRTDCLYAAAMSCVTNARPGVNTTIYTSWLCSLIESAFPEDADYLIKLRPQGLQGNIDTQLLRNDIVDDASREPSPKRRADQVTYPVGKLFRHRLFGYWAVVTGYDARCEATQQWISQMQVDNLEFGRHQPFYNVVAEDNSQRYVAQENIPARSTPFEASIHSSNLSDDELPILANVELGKYFLRTERTKAGEIYFVPNARTRQEFPDDVGFFERE